MFGRCEPVIASVLFRTHVLWDKSPNPELRAIARSGHRTQTRPKNFLNLALFCPVPRDSS
jgi:hypothetical protein